MSDGIHQCSHLGLECGGAGRKRELIMNSVSLTEGHRDGSHSVTILVICVFQRTRPHHLRHLWHVEGPRLGVKLEL